MTINRKELIAEELIRQHIRKRIAVKLEQQRLAEEKIRKVVRRLIEAETGTEEPRQDCDSLPAGEACYSRGPEGSTEGCSPLGGRRAGG